MYFWIYFRKITYQLKIKMDIKNAMLDEKTEIFYKFLKRNVDCPNVVKDLKSNAS